MASITLGGAPAETVGDLPSVGSTAPAFTLANKDLDDVSLSDYSGKKVILNIFPSVNTGVCAASVREFNQRASSLDNTVVLCISMDLPFAQAQFCGAEGIENVIMLSCFRDNGDFSSDYGVRIKGGKFAGLNARSVVVLDDAGKVLHSELVSEIGNEPNYENAIAAL